MLRATAEPPAEAPPRLNLNLLMVFREIVRGGSICRTAERLQTPKATLSRQLRQLEQQVGAVLLKRGPHHLEMTGVGRALLAHCERIAAEAADASSVASDMQSRLRGEMSVCIPFGLGNSPFSRALARFALLYPEVRLTIEVTNRWVDVSTEPYDVAIYIGRVRNEHLPARRLVEVPRGWYASPSYLERRGVPRTPGDLLVHDCIALESQLRDQLWTVVQADGTTRNVAPRVRTTDIVVAREMALADLGVAMLAEPVCAADVKAARLLRVLHEWPVPPVLVTAMYLERRLLPLRIRVFIDLVAEAMRGDLMAEAMRAELPMPARR